jgi:anti-sigma B factor antagonist
VSTSPVGAAAEGAAGNIRVVRATDTITALDLDGEFDISTAPELVERVRSVLDQGKHLIINLSDASFIDSSIVHALFTADTEARQHGRVFVLQFGTAARVERVLTISGADKKLLTAPTRADAIDLIHQYAAASA